MASAIGPGDWVECVGPFSGPSAMAEIHRAGFTIVGSYRVGLISVCEAVTDRMQMPNGSIVPGLRVRDVKAFKAGREVWLAAHQWRPVYRPNASIIEALKQPLPDLVDA